MKNSLIYIKHYLWEDHPAMETWLRLKKRKIAFLSLCFLVFLALIAVYAPFLANDLPFVIHTKNPVLFQDALDNAQGTLEVIQRDLASGKTADSNQLAWLISCLHEVKDFLENSRDREILASMIPSLKVEKSPDFSWKVLEKKLIDLNESSPNLRSRVFFPLLRNLNSSELFFIFLIPLLAAFFWIKRKISFFARRDFWFYLLFALFTALFLSTLTGLLKPNRFDPYSYQKMTEDFTTGEWALFPLVPFGENQNRISEASQPPTFLLKEKKPDQAFHLLGTDTNGRDVLARMIYGTQISMSIGFVAVGIYVLIGIFLGALAGYYGGWADQVISRFTEIMICFPVFFLILTVMAFLKPSIFNIMVIIGLTGWPGIARLMRGEFLKLVNREFVLAARALGAGDFRIIFHHILPNGLAPILISATFGIAGAILTESALSFLGFGVPQPTASWGDLLNNGRNDIYGSWWLTVFPGFAIFLTVTAFNLIGETLRDLLDPRLRGVGES